jgi:hypothetical protein
LRRSFLGEKWHRPRGKPGNNGNLEQGFGHAHIVDDAPRWQRKLRYHETQSARAHNQSGITQRP